MRRMKKFLCALLCCLLLAGFMPVKAQAATVTGSCDSWVYCGGIVDLWADVSEGADRAVYQWQVDASFGDGSWYDLEESGGIYGYHGVKTNHMQFVTPPQDNTYEYGTGWEDIPFRCKVTLDGETFYTQEMYMNMTAYSSFRGALKRLGLGLKEPVISGTSSLVGTGKEWSGTVSAGQELWISANEVPVTDPLMLLSNLVFTPEIWITCDGKTTHSERNMRYTPVEVGKEVVIEIRLLMKLGVNDMGCYDTHTTRLTVQEPNSVGKATTKTESSLLRNMYNEAEKLVRIPKGTTVSIVKDMGSGWYKVFYGGYVGYIPSSGLTMQSEQIEPEIEEVYIALEEPAIGNAPQYNPPVNTTGCELYSVEPVTWIDKETNKFMKPGEKFQEGHGYTVQIWVAAKDGYSFRVDAYDNIQTKGYINTRQAKAVKAYEQDPSRVIELSYDYAPMVNIHTCKLSLVKRVEPTCQNLGKEAYFLCECGAAYADSRGTQPINVDSWGNLPAVDHKAEADWSYNGTHHYKKCIWCRTVCAGTTAKHTGGSATCQKKAECSACGAVYGQTGDVHRWQDGWGYTSAEGHAAVCADCQAHDALKKHTPGAAATEKTPQLCEDCGYILASVKNHTHKLTEVKAEPPTCTQPGNIGYYTCSGCSQLFADAAGKNPLAKDAELTVACKGHVAAEEWEWDDSFHWRSCTVCGERLDETKMSHEFEQDRCTSCGMTLKEPADSGSGQEPGEQPESQPENLQQPDASSESAGDASSGDPADTQSKPQLKPEQILKPEQSIDGEPDGDNDTNSEPVQQNAQRTPYKTIILIMLCSAGVSALVTALLVEKKKKRQP